MSSINMSPAEETRPKVLLLGVIEQYVSFCFWVVVYLISRWTGAGGEDKAKMENADGWYQLQALVFPGSHFQPSSPIRERVAAADKYESGPDDKLLIL